MACLARVCEFPRKKYSMKKLLVFLLTISICLIFIIWRESHPLSYEYAPSHEHTTARLPNVTESFNQHMRGLSIEQELLKAVGKLHFKVMTPSYILLDDFYYIPSTHKLVDYNNVILHQPISCGESEFLLVLMPSHPSSVRERRAIRETWGTVARGRSWPRKGNGYHVKLVFVLGVFKSGPLTESSNVLDNPKYNLSGNDSNSSVVDQKHIFSQKDNDTFFKLSKTTATPVTKRLNERYDNSKHISTNERHTASHDIRREENGADLNISDNLTASHKEHGYNNLSRVPVKTPNYTKTIRQNAKAQADLIQEISLFNDILQFYIIDTYANLTRKMIMSLQWSVKYCTTAKYILKVDHDVFVNIPLLTTFLKHNGERNSIYGHIYPNSWVEREGKWAVPEMVLPIIKYPIYAAGNAYVLSKDAAEKVIEQAPYFQYVHVEDAFITGILASVGGVNRVFVSGFTQWTESLPDPCDFVRDRKYSGNKFSEYDLRIFWREIIDDGNSMCDT